MRTSGKDVAIRPISVVLDEAANQISVTIFLVAYAHESGLGDMGGIRKVLSLAEGMRRMGHKVFVFLPAYLGLSEPGIVAYFAPSIPGLRPGIGYLCMAISLIRFSVKHRPGIIYLRTCLTFLPAVAARLARARFFFEINGDVLSEKARSVSLLRSLLTVISEWVNCRFADRVIAITPGLARMAEERYGISKDRIRIIPSGADTETIRPRDVRECRKSLGISPDYPCVAFIGVLYYHQGVQTLLESTPAILKKFPNVRILVIGDGPFRGELESLAKKLSIDSSVRFTGRVPFDQVPVYLGASDCCVAPFKENRGETSPLKLFDYMAAGRPIVACAIASISELISDSGAIVPVRDDPKQLAETIIALLQDPDRMRRMGICGRDFVEKHHGWNALAQRTLA